MYTGYAGKLISAFKKKAMLAAQNTFPQPFSPENWQCKVVNMVSMSRYDQHCRSGCHDPDHRLFHWDHHQQSGIDVDVNVYVYVAVDFHFDFDVGGGVYIGFDYPADQRLQIRRPTAVVQSSRCRWVVWSFTRSGTQLRHLGFSSTEKLLGLSWLEPGWHQS